MQLNKLQDLWNNVLGSDDIEVVMFAYNALVYHISQKPNTANQKNHLILTFKHRGGGLMIEVVLQLQHMGTYFTVKRELI